MSDSEKRGEGQITIHDLDNYADTIHGLDEWFPTIADMEAERRRWPREERPIRREPGEG